MDMRDNPNYYYTDRPYKPKLICCDCRKVFKRRLNTDFNSPDVKDDSELICPNCGKPANYVGPKFRAPKSENVKAWKSIQVLNEIGVLHFMGFASDKIIIPESSKALTDLLIRMKVHYQNTIESWVRMAYDEQNKMQIKAFAALIKKIDKYLQI